MTQRTYLLETNGELKLVSKKNKQPKIVSQNGNYVHINEITYEKEVLDFVESHVKKRNTETKQKAKWFEYVEMVDRAANSMFNIKIIGPILRVICNLFIKASFPSVIIAYMIMMTISFGNTNEATGMGFYMGILSIAIAILYSQIVENLINKTIPSHYKLYAFETKDLVLFTFAVAIAFLVYVVFEIVKFDMGGNLGNVLTWLSLVICFVDRIISKYN